MLSGCIDEATSHQIHIDILRTNQNTWIFQQKPIQESLERILYCWAVRHPASGYVQGINDIIIPFYVVFLSEYFNIEDSSQSHTLPDVSCIQCVEADSYWCLSKLLENLQDNYTSGQPGIFRKIAQFKRLMQRIDGALVAHFERQQLDFEIFSFRWMNCLLVREFSYAALIRMWDTYLVIVHDYAYFPFLVVRRR